MNLSNQDIEYLYSLKNSAVNIQNTGLGNFHKYLVSGYSINNNYLIEGPDNSVTQITNPGGKNIRINNELIKFSSTIDNNNILLRISKKINDNTYDINITFDDLLYYKNIKIEIDFINENSTLNINLPNIIENDLLTPTFINFYENYKVKNQMDIIPINYIFNHIQIKSNPSTIINIHRNDYEETNNIEKENIYIISNKTINKLLQKQQTNKNIIILENNHIIEGDKLAIYKNIEISSDNLKNNLGFFYERNDSNLVAFKLIDVPDNIKNSFSRYFGLVLGDYESMIEKIKILINNNRYPIEHIYPQSIFQLLNGAYCAVYSSMNNRNNAAELLTFSNYHSKNLPIRDNLYTFKIHDFGSSNIQSNYKLLTLISSLSYINNVTMNNNTIWITIEYSYLDSFLDILNKNSMKFEYKETIIYSSYLTKYILKQLYNEINQIEKYILIGNNRELIISKDKIIIDTNKSSNSNKSERRLKKKRHQKSTNINENSISENSISENTISENTISQHILPVKDLPPSI